MILGGIMEMLMPVPKATSALSEDKSKYLPANKNTVKVGTPIPLLFGRGRMYGHFLSFDIDSTNHPSITTGEITDDEIAGKAIVVKATPQSLVTARLGELGLSI